MANWAIIIVLLPLFNFLLLGLAGNRIKGIADKLASTSLLIATGLSISLFYQCWSQQQVFSWDIEWFNISTTTFTLSLFIDKTSSMMLVVVTGISFLVHLFSIDYMHGDKHYVKYFAYLGVFTFSMLGLVLVRNLILIYIFWELVGLSSYLLIGFWREKPAANRAAKKAFLLNRIGDAGFLIGILVLYSIYHTSNLGVIIQENQLLEPTPEAITWLTIAGIGLFIGAVGKSAQFPLSAWLPDAMEGPTPVSALIHAATMVAAGVYLMARVYFLLTPEVHILIASIGTLTSVLAAFAALSQFDIKKVLAYSTISQLGYMIAGIGVGAKDAALFHLLTHAFFKACLFLGAGAVIHALHQVAHKLEGQGITNHFDAQDMRLMGGLKNKLPVTFITFLIASAALAGLPLTSGFLSKDAILMQSLRFASTGNNLLLWLIPIGGFLTAFMTAFYVGKLILKVFFGTFRLERLIENASEHLEEVGIKMKIPLVILGLGSLWFVFSFNPLDADIGWFLSSMQEQASNKPFKSSTEIISTLLAFSGILIASQIYWKESLKSLKNSVIKHDSFIYQLSLNFWYQNAFYEKSLKGILLFSTRALKHFDTRYLDKNIDRFVVLEVVIAHLIRWFDKYIVDGLVNGSVYITGRAGNFTRSIQGSQVQSFFIWALLGLTSLIFWLAF